MEEEKRRESNSCRSEWAWEERFEGIDGLQYGEFGHIRELTCVALDVWKSLELELRWVQGYGTAIGVITSLFEQDHLDRAYYAQTTPYHQGLHAPSIHGYFDIDQVLG